MRRRHSRSAMAIALIALALLGVGLAEGDVADDLTHVGSLVVGLLDRYGAAACLGLLYVEESGVPLPVPGDFYIAFMGKLYAGSIPNLLAAWLGIIAVVVAGSSQLYWPPRRRAPALPPPPLAARPLHHRQRRLAPPA